MPPVVIGPMIIIIGLSLLTAVAESGLMGIEPLLEQGKYLGLEGALGKYPWYLYYFRNRSACVNERQRFSQVIPFLVAIIVGYASSVALGLVDLKSVFAGASFFKFLISDLLVRIS